MRDYRKQGHSVSRARKSSFVWWTVTPDFPRVPQRGEGETAQKARGARDARVRTRNTKTQGADDTDRTCARVGVGRASRSGRPSENRFFLRCAKRRRD